MKKNLKQDALYPQPKKRGLTAKKEKKKVSKITTIDPLPEKLEDFLIKNWCEKMGIKKKPER